MAFSRKWQSRGRKNEKNKIPLWLNVLAWFALAISIWFIWESIGIYVGMGVKLVQAQAAEDAMVGRWWTSLALASWIKVPLSMIFGLVSASIGVLGMTIVYGILQLCELAPMMVEHSPELMLRLIKGIESFTKIEILEIDSPMVQVLKEKHNNFAEDWVDTLYSIKPIAYLVDLVFCLIAAPPIEGGWDRFDIFISAGTWSDVDFGNIFSVMITLFSVEVCFSLWMFVKKGKSIFGDIFKFSLS